MNASGLTYSPPYTFLHLNAHLTVSCRIWSQYVKRIYGHHNRKQGGNLIKISISCDLILGKYRQFYLYAFTLPLFFFIQMLKDHRIIVAFLSKKISGDFWMRSLQSSFATLIRKRWQCKMNDLRMILKLLNIC